MYIHLGWIVWLQHPSSASVITQQCCNLHAIQCNRDEFYKKIHAVLSAPDTQVHSGQLRFAHWNKHA